MARPEEFKYESHCCGHGGGEEELILICKVCPPFPGMTHGHGFEVRVEGGSFAAAVDAVADHVHRDPAAKPCHRIIDAAQHRHALGV